MNSPLIQVLFNTLMLLLLNSLIQLNANPVILPDSECSQVTSDSTKENSLYSHSEIFGTAATLKDVEAFKYYCTNDLIVSMINMEMVGIIYLYSL